MVAAGDSGRNYAQRLGIQNDQIVQELGWDTDADDDIRAEVEEICGSELLDEDADEVIDVVLLWWRDGDGDLVDRLMDAITPLAEDGVIWVLTPKTGKPALQRRGLGGCMLEHAGDPAEFGDACAYLCSAQAGFIIGQNLLLDGGAYPGPF